METENTLPAVIEGEVETAVTLWRTNDPVEIVEKAAAVASVLSNVIQKQKLFSDIKGRRHVRVEGWSLCGTLLGVQPVVEWSRPLPDGRGYEARVVARTMAGVDVGAAEAMCTRDEFTWKDRDDYALRSMAQTRATSKALRGPLGFIVSLAGFETTPFEEMPVLDGIVVLKGQTPGPSGDDQGALPDAPTDLPKVKRDLLTELESWPVEARDGVVRKCSTITDDNGQPKLKDGKPICIESVEKLLNPRISVGWAGATIGRVREMKSRIASKENPA